MKNKKINRVFTILLSAILLFVALSFTSCIENESDERYEHECTLYIECKSILNNMTRFNMDKLEVLPGDGIILKETSAGFNDGETVYDVFRRETRARGILAEANFTPGFGSAYIEGIGNIYEFDCGEGSGWLYTVNGASMNLGTSAYRLQNGDRIGFHYTCDYGNDIETGMRIGE